ncbi:kinase-like protein [Ceratobasidium sp. AG-I]|nr:kinase-like protein [Ceratobasidium sp. AG-I]
MSRLTGRKVGDSYLAKVSRSSSRIPGRSASDSNDSALAPPDKRPRLNSRPSTNDASAVSRFLPRDSDLLLSIPIVKSPDEIDDYSFSTSANGTIELLDELPRNAIAVASSSSRSSLPAALNPSNETERDLALLHDSVSRLSLQDPPPSTPPRTSAKPFTPVTTQSPEHTRISLSLDRTPEPERRSRRSSFLRGLGLIQTPEKDGSPRKHTVKRRMSWTEKARHGFHLGSTPRERSPSIMSASHPGTNSPMAAQKPGQPRSSSDSNVKYGPSRKRRLSDSSLAAISDREDEDRDEKPSFISKMFDRLTPKKDILHRPGSEGATAKNTSSRRPLHIRHTPGIYLEDASIPNSPVHTKPTSTRLLGGDGPSMYSLRSLSHEDISSSTSMPKHSNLSPLTDLMPASKIIALLKSHGCLDITKDLDLEKCTKHPLFGGGFGDIYFGKLRDGTQVAIKSARHFIGSTEGYQQSLKRIAQELYTWSKCKHDNVLALIGLAQFNGRIAMISPWMSNGTLLEYISRHPLADRCQLGYQTASGVEYLHHIGTVRLSLNLAVYEFTPNQPTQKVHGDLKAANVLVSRTGIAKLADFGNSIKKNATMQFVGSVSGSRISARWTAPEQLNGTTKYTTEADVYALGMTLLEIITGSLPHQDINDMQVMFKVGVLYIHPDRPTQDIPTGSEHGDRLWGLLIACWDKDPKARPPALDVREAKLEDNNTDSLNEYAEPDDDSSYVLVSIASDNPIQAGHKTPAAQDRPMRVQEHLPIFEESTSMLFPRQLSPEPSSTLRTAPSQIAVQFPEQPDTCSNPENTNNRTGRTPSFLRRFSLLLAPSSKESVEGQSKGRKAHRSFDDRNGPRSRNYSAGQHTSAGATGSVSPEVNHPVQLPLNSAANAESTPGSKHRIRYRSLTAISSQEGREDSGFATNFFGRFSSRGPYDHRLAGAEEAEGGVTRPGHATYLVDSAESLSGKSSPPHSAIHRQHVKSQPSRAQTSNIHNLRSLSHAGVSSCEGLTHHVVPSLVITDETPAFKVIALLKNHGCQDITRDLDPSECTKYPVYGGGFGDIYSGKLRDGTEVAIKVARHFAEVTVGHQQTIKHLAKELYTWSKCSHNNVLGLLGLAHFNGRIAMISPWMSNGTLLKYLSSNPAANRCRMGYQIAAGVEYLHSIGTVHGDLKSSNVLVSNDGVAKLADFGNSIKKNGTMQFAGSISGSKISARWTAPEQLHGTTKYTTEADVYALGMTLLEMITGKPPYQDFNDMQVMYKVGILNIFPERPEEISAVSEDGNRLWELFMDCWKRDPKARPSASNVKKIMGSIEQTKLKL